MKSRYCSVILFLAIMIFLSALSFSDTAGLSQRAAMFVDPAVAEFERGHSMCAAVLMNIKSGEMVYVYNRSAVYGKRFPPGSLAKTWSALVLLDHRDIMDFDEKKKLTCRGRYYPELPMSFFPADYGSFNLPVDESGRRYFRCSLRDGHGEMALEEALVHSCNAYFLMAASRNASEFFCLLVNTFSLDRNTGAQLVGSGEGDAVIDSRKATIFQLAASAIGEGGLIRVSPLKVAQLYAAVFSGGSMPVPFERPFEGNAKRARVDVSSAGLRFVSSALRKVFKEGTLKKLGRERFNAEILSGKTGTATRYREKYGTHGWNALLLEIQGKEYVLVTFVEKGSGSGEALELSRTILRNL